MNHYYIVSSTGARDCTVYDITGEQIHYPKSKAVNVSRIMLDLDGCIFHKISTLRNSKNCWAMTVTTWSKSSTWSEKRGSSCGRANLE